MSERVELRLISDDEVKIIAYEWDGLKLVLVETTYSDRSEWVSSQLGDAPPDDGWWLDSWCAEHEYNTWDDICWIPFDDDEEEI